MKALPKLLKLTLLPVLTASLNAATYQVKSGDTLSSIARKNGTTASQLMKDNGISNPNLLKVGQKLKVSGKAASTPAPKAKAPKASSSSGNYTVQSGETLYSIARKHGLSVSQLTNLNPGLDPSKISVGQKLITKGSIKKSTPKAAPKKTRNTTTIAKKATPPKPAQTSQPKPASKPAELASIPAPAPEEPVVEKIELPSSISTVVVRKEIAFGKLASKHRTTPKQLNELNGWSLKPTTILAKGSEIYVPGA